MADFTCKCGHRFFGASFLGKCPACGSDIRFGSVPESVQETKAEWPLWARIIAKQRKADDSGVGDTFKRLADKLGGEAIKRFSERLGMPCGCAERQEEWNRSYQY